MESLAELILKERLEKINRMMESGQLQVSHYNKAVISLLDGLVAISMH